MKKSYSLRNDSFAREIRGKAFIFSCVLAMGLLRLLLRTHVITCVWNHQLTRETTREKQISTLTDFCPWVSSSEIADTLDRLSGSKRLQVPYTEGDTYSYVWNAFEWTMHGKISSTFSLLWYTSWKYIFHFQFVINF